MSDEALSTRLRAPSLSSNRRASHWRKRDDGLAAFYRSLRAITQDYRDARFRDCGDRVAQTSSSIEDA